MSRRAIVIGWALAGAAIGSGFGIAGFGDAISATIPFAAVAACMALLATRPATEGMPGPIEEMLRAIAHGLCLGWNMLMHLLVALRLMPYFARRPWLLAVLMIGLMAVLPIAAPALAAAGLMALRRKVRAADNFFIRPALTP